MIERWDAQPDQTLVSRRRRTCRRCGERRPHLFDDLRYPKTWIDSWGELTSDKRGYDLHKVLIPDLKAIHKWLAETPRGAAGVLAPSAALPRGIARGDRPGRRAATRLEARRHAELQVRRLPCTRSVPARSNPANWPFPASQRSAAASSSANRQTSVRLHARHRAQGIAANARLYQNPGLLRAPAQTIRDRQRAIGRVGRFCRW